MMNKDLNGFQFLIAFWIKGDTLLWSSLERGQIKLLYERIVKNLSFERLSELHNLSPAKLRAIYQATIFSIEKTHGQSIALLLREADNGIETKRYGFQIRKGGYEFDPIWLN